MKRHLQYGRRLIGLAALVLVSGMVLLTPGDAQAFCENRDDGSKCHPDLAEDALGFLSPYVLERLREEINEPDHGSSASVSDNHFDNCNMDGGTDRINDRYLNSVAYGRIGIVHALSPFTFSIGQVSKRYPEVFVAIDGWAWGLHAAQDFYSHSNWIEMGFTDWRDRDNLIDSRLQSWVELPSNWGVVRGDILAAQDDPPSGRSVTRPAGSFVPTVVKPNGQRFRLLISGHTDISPPFNSCPDTAAARIHHDTLNKDNITRPNYAKARDMAIAQTRHEWCRLLHLSEDAYGFPATSVMMGLMVRPGASPHPAWTACAEPPAGRVQVNVRLDKLKIVDNGDDNDAQAELNYVLALYTEDFTRSIRSQTPATIFATSGTLVPEDQLPPPVSLCIEPGQRLVATVQGWDDDDDRGTPKLGWIDDGDDARTGVTYQAGSGGALSNGQGVGTFERDSDNPDNKDIETKFVIDATPTDADGDGLTYCQELAAGLDPNSVHSDGDGVRDDREVHLDTGFGSEGGRTVTDFDGQHERAFAAVVLPDGKILLVGDAETTGPFGQQVALARYRANGTPDGSFGVSGRTVEGQANDDWGRAVALAPSGKIVVAGFRQARDNDFAVWRFNSNGTLDTTFAIGFGFNVADFGLGDDYGQAVMVQPDEKIIVAGFVASGTSIDPDRRAVGLVRFRSSGALDTTFGANGRVLTPVGSGYLSVRGAALQPDGKIVVAGGHQGDFLLLRYKPDGALDPTFGGDGIVKVGLGGNDEARAVAVLPTGAIVVAGASNGDLSATLLNANGGECTTCGSLKTDFGGNEGAFAVAVQPDGGIVLAGAANGADPLASRFYLTRFRESRLHFGYELDETFGVKGKLVSAVANRDVARAAFLDSSLRLVVAGYAHNGRDDDFVVSRYVTGLTPPSPQSQRLYLPLVNGS